MQFLVYLFYMLTRKVKRYGWSALWTARTYLTLYDDWPREEKK